MDKIQVHLVDSSNLNRIVQMACEITRGANKFETPEALLNKIDKYQWNEKRILKMLELPHSKISRFTDLTFLITGASRRFLAQITTHHVGISIMSGSLQYSDHSKEHLNEPFVVPYELIQHDHVTGEMHCSIFLEKQHQMLEHYKQIVETGYDRDTAGYTMPQSLRNILLVKVNLEALRWIGNQRLCRRNTDETVYVVGLMVEHAVNTFELPSDLFMPSCHTGKCNEGVYTCGRPIKTDITTYLDETFEYIRHERKSD